MKRPSIKLFILALLFLRTLLSAPASAADDRMLFIPEFYAPEMVPCVHDRLLILVPRLRRLEWPEMKGEQYFEVTVLCDGKSPTLACSSKVKYVLGKPFFDRYMKPDIGENARKWAFTNISQDLDFVIAGGTHDKTCQRLTELLSNAMLRFLAQ